MLLQLTHANLKRKISINSAHVEWVMESVADKCTHIKTGSGIVPVVETKLTVDIELEQALLSLHGGKPYATNQTDPRPKDQMQEFEARPHSTTQE